MTASFSKNQIDQLGNRLREGLVSQDDLRTLDEYRRGFSEAYESVVQTIREQLRLEPTGRPAKSTTSIIEKLRRETIRLSQVQDIAGCRIVQANLAEQERALAALRNVFRHMSVVDRRLHPSYGYRAIHGIVQVSGRLVEIQLRTRLQHVWAEASEKVSDILDSTIKYGGGPATFQDRLVFFSEWIASLEEAEAHVARTGAGIALIKLRPDAERFREELDQLQAMREAVTRDVLRAQRMVNMALKDLVAEFEKVRDQPDDLPD